MNNSITNASAKDLQTIRNFFTDSQWDVIDAALSEYQDHDDSQEVLDIIGAKLQTVFDNTTEEN